MTSEQIRKYQRLGILATAVFVAVGGVLAIFRQELSYFGRFTGEPVSFYGTSAIVIGLSWLGIAGLLLARVVTRKRWRYVLSSAGLSFLLGAFVAQVYVVIVS